MNTKHTTGIWEIDAEDMADEEALTIGIYVIRPDGSREEIGSANGFIAEEFAPGVYGAGLRGDRETVRANARLMSAALQLLEAANAAMQCIGELSPTQARVEVAQMLQTAIAKATGA